MTRPPTRAELRLAAKRTNEHVKLASSSITNGGLTLIGGSFFAPALAGNPDRVQPFWIMVGLLFILAGQCVLGFLRSEEV